MIARWNQTLGILLLVQLLLVAFTRWPRGEDEAPSTPLVPYARDAITEIEIVRGGDDATPVRLTNKGDDGWVVASAMDYPADAGKITELLDHLTTMTVRKPVATQTTSHGSLKVAEQDFGRKVRVKAGGDEVSFFVGAARSSAVNARRAGETEVYEVKGVSEYDLKDTAKGFIDTAYVTTSVEDVGTFTVKNAAGTFTLERTADKTWTVQGGSDLPLDPSAADSLVKKIASIRLADPAGREMTPEMGLDGSTRVEWTTLETAAGQENGEPTTKVLATRSHGLTIGSTTEANAFVKSDESPFVVKTYDANVKPLKEATLASLAPKEKSADAPELPEGSFQFGE